MDWYYSVGGEQKGPVSEREFQRLVQQGVINTQTLVWREGMAQWQPFSGMPPSAPAHDSPSDVTCVGCGGRFGAGEVVSLEGRSYCAACKPLALQRMREGVTSDPAAEAIRKEHLSHESSIRTVGFLYLLGGVGAVIAGIGGSLTGGRSGAVEQFLVSGLLLILGGGQFWVGLAVRKLRPWARIPTIILSGIGLLGFPVGTIINGYILYLVLCQKGKTVFSEEYQSIVQQTPHIKQRTSIVVWIVLGILLLILGIVVLGAIFGRSR